jgi:hypothetical protein
MDGTRTTYSQGEKVQKYFKWSFIVKELRVGNSTTFIEKTMEFSNKR